LQRVQEELTAKEAQLQQLHSVSAHSTSSAFHTSSHTETSSHLVSEQLNVVNVTRVMLKSNHETDPTALQRMLEEAEGRIIELELMISKMREEHDTQCKAVSMKLQASEELSAKYRRDQASSETLLIDAKQELSGLRPRYDAVLAKLNSMEPQLEKLRNDCGTATSRLSLSEMRCAELTSVSEGLRARLTVAEQVCGCAFYCTLCCQHF
jgi:chromosome segregation ATPase